MVREGGTQEHSDFAEPRHKLQFGEAKTAGGVIQEKNKDNLHKG